MVTEEEACFKGNQFNTDDQSIVDQSIQMIDAVMVMHIWKAVNVDRSVACSQWTTLPGYAQGYYGQRYMIACHSQAMHCSHPTQKLPGHHMLLNFHSDTSKMSRRCQQWLLQWLHCQVSIHVHFFSYTSSSECIQWQTYCSMGL